MQRIITTLVFLISAYVYSIAGPAISFQVSMPHPSTHTYSVEMSISGDIKDTLILKLPVWTPGYYKIMDYPKNLYGFEIHNSRKEELRWEKTSKNTWIVYTNGANNITARYKIYAFSKSVADSYLDSEMSFISPTGLFMHISGMPDAPVKVTIHPYQEWNTVSTGLNRLPEKGYSFMADNFDELYDCPVLTGNHNEIKFDVNGILYTIACSKNQNFNKDDLIPDLTKIINKITGMFGHIPYKHYTFIIMDEGRGGLEHQNSMAIFSKIPQKNNQSDYKDWLYFVTHEFFHLYNVKAIRPANLTPYDYDKENYTNMLWVSEGFTVYYEYIILLRAGLINSDEFLENLSSSIRNYENIPGHLYQSATQSSFDAWIDFFQFKENKKNTSISYYDKGCALGLLLDLKIRHETQNKKSIDDVMIQLYNEFYLKKKSGFTDEEFNKTCEDIAGCNLDEILNLYASTTHIVDYPKYLGYAGLTVDTTTQIIPGANLGAEMKEQGGKIIITSIISGSAAEKAGLNIYDKIIKMNDTPAGLELINGQLTKAKPGDDLELVVIRDNKEYKYDVILSIKTTKTYAINKSSELNKSQELLLKNWLLE